MKYAVLVKNSDESYDILNFINYYDDSATASLLDAALSDLSNPIVAMDASDHKITATRGATWNGTSFSGGIVSKAADATAEELVWIPATTHCGDSPRLRNLQDSCRQDVA